MVTLWWRSLLIGFAIAAPVGPIGLLCIQRTLQRGRTVGLISGLGAATADAFYGMVAGFGITLIANFLLGQQLWLGLVGGLFLCYLGLRTWQTPPATVAASLQFGGLWQAYGSTLVLTLTNPMTIFSFMAIFAGMGLATQSTDYSGALVVVLGVFCGSAAWWLLLSGGVALVRDRLSASVLGWINRGAGVVLFGFGLFLLVTLWR
ncbi:MAG: LysE family transporter [Caldilineaceae bacterium]